MEQKAAEDCDALTGEVAEESLLRGLSEQLCALDLDGTIAGILHTVNDSLADIIKSDRTECPIWEKIFSTRKAFWDLRFKISPFSFFQTNSLGAEVAIRN